MSKKNNDIQIDGNNIDKINIYKFQFGDKVPNITDQIEKRLEHINSEKEKLLKLCPIKKKKIHNVIRNKFKTRTATTKRKTKKTLNFNLLSTFGGKYKKNIFEISNSLFNRTLKSVDTHSSESNKKIQFKNSIFPSEKQNKVKYRNSSFFITENKQKKRLLDLTSNFSRNNSEINFISPMIKYGLLNNNNNHSFNDDEEIQLINNSNSNSNSNSSSYSIYGRKSLDSFDLNKSKIKKKTNKSNISYINKIKIRKNNIPHPIYKQLNDTLEKTKKIKNDIENYSNSLNFKNSEKEDNFENTNQIIPLDKKDKKYFIYKLGYYMSLDPKFKDSLSTTKTISLLNPISSFIFKEAIGKEMEIKIKYQPLDQFKFIPNRFFDNAFKKPQWVEKKNLQLKEGFKLIYNKAEKNNYELKRIKLKHNI